MTVEETAARLGTSVRVVQQMCKTGVLGATPPKGWDVCEECLKEYLARPRGPGKRQARVACEHSMKRG